MTTLDIITLAPLVHAYYPTEWPWMQVGVFPTSDQDVTSRSWFNYTVGLGAAELWMPCQSIEGRALGNEMTGEVLNMLAGAWQMGLVHLGDDVTVPVGIADDDGEWERDAEAVVWISTYRVPSRTKQVFVPGAARWTVPLLWSSPLGWPDD
jgi:hypothetical protein